MSKEATEFPFNSGKLTKERNLPQVERHVPINRTVGAEAGRKSILGELLVHILRVLVAAEAKQAPRILHILHGRLAVHGFATALINSRTQTQSSMACIIFEPSVQMFPGP